MAVLEGAVSAALAEVDATLKALKVTGRPPETLNWNTLAGSSGLLTGVAAAGALFSFRNLGANPIMVRRLLVGFAVTTAFTTAQALAFSLLKATAFSVSDTGGTALYTAGQNKHRSGMGNVATAPDCRICTTGALGAGTRTLESQPMGLVCGGATAVGVSLSPQPLFSHDAEDYPLILAQNEGLIVQNDIAMGAAGVVRLQGIIEFAELSSVVF